MKKLLYINGNPQSEDLSYSRKVGRYYLDSQADKEVEVEVLNLYDETIPLIDQDVIEAWQHLRKEGEMDSLTKDQQSTIKRMNQLLKQFKSADTYVIVSPLWNFSISPKLKAYIDTVMIAGETFKYTESGPVGLMMNKSALIVQASGGVYTSGPAAPMEHGANYLETVLNFMGIKDVEIIRVEGVAIPGKSREERLEEAYQQVDELEEQLAA